MATKLCKRDRHFQPIPSRTRILVLNIILMVMGALTMSLPPKASFPFDRQEVLVMTSILHFLKVHIRPLRFWKRLILVPVFANERNPKNIFTFMKIVVIVLMYVFPTFRKWDILSTLCYFYLRKVS